jgi:phosphoglycerate kinase
MPDFPRDPEQGIAGIDTSINLAIRDLRERKIGGIYLPNTRWFQNEEAGVELRERFALQLAGLADIYVNDAFGSWQPHASTYNITRHLPSCAGFLLQQEIAHLDGVMNPERPFLAVVAGSKYDTKIKPLNAIYDRWTVWCSEASFNTYLCAKYGIRIKGVSDEDRALARDLVEKDRAANKIVELPLIVESDVSDGRIEGRYAPFPSGLKPAAL